MEVIPHFNGETNKIKLGVKEVRRTTHGEGLSLSKLRDT